MCVPIVSQNLADSRCVVHAIEWLRTLEQVDCPSSPYWYAQLRPYCTKLVRAVSYVAMFDFKKFYLKIISNHTTVARIKIVQGHSYSLYSDSPISILLRLVSMIRDTFVLKHLRSWCPLWPSTPNYFTVYYLRIGVFFFVTTIWLPISQHWYLNLLFIFQFCHLTQ